MTALRTALVLSVSMALLPVLRTQELAAPATPADELGDALPDGVRARLGTMRFRHGTTLAAVHFCSDGKTLLSVGRDRTARLWDAATGKEQRQNTLGDGREFFVAPGGRVVAAVNEFRGLQLWDVNTGKELGNETAHVAIEHGGVPVFSPDGKTLAAIVSVSDDAEQRGGKVLRRWNAATGARLGDLRPPKAKDREVRLLPYSVFFSADSKIIGALREGDFIASINQFGIHQHPVQLWDVTTGKEVGQLGGVSLLAAALAPDGKRLVGISAEGRNARLGVWDVATGKHLASLGELPLELAQLVTYRGSDFRFSADGKRLAVKHTTVASRRGRGTTQVWDLDAKKEVTLPQLGEGDAYVTVAFSPEGATLAAGSSTGVIHLCDAAGKSLHAWKGYQPAAGNPHYEFEPFDSTIAFTPDGRLVVATGTGGLVRRWEVATGKELLAATNSPESEVLGVAYAPDGKRLATACSDGSVRVWDMASGKEFRRLVGPPVGEAAAGRTNQAFAVAFTPDGRSLVTGWLSGALQVWDVERGKQVHQLAGHSSVVAALAVTPDGRRLASADWAGNIFWWDLADGKQLKQLAAAGPAQKIAMSPGGRLLAAVGRSGTSKYVRVWELSSGELRRRFAVPAPGQALNDSDMTFADGFFLSGGGYGGANGVFYSDRDPFTGVAFSPDGKTLAWTAGTLVRLWDPLRGRERRQWGGAEATLHGLAYSPDGKILAAPSSDGTIRLWEAETGNALATLAGHRGGVRCLAFSSDGATLASGGSDTTVLIWDVAHAVKAGQTRSPAIPQRELAELWERLASNDVGSAGDALARLADAPAQAVPLLREQLRPVPVEVSTRIKRLLADLESDRFEVRKRATDELSELGQIAEPYLRAKLLEQVPLETQRRLQALLDKLVTPFGAPELVRPLRALEVLEQAGTPEAVALLRDLAKGAPEARLTQEAQAALRRLSQPLKAP